MADCSQVQALVVVPDGQRDEGRPAGHRERSRPRSWPGARARRVAWALAAGGLLAYNWWVLVPLRPGLMHSPNELFSNLEVTGQPYAAAMQRADMLAGLLLASAFLAVGAGSLPGARREWLGLLVFALAGCVGGIFPQVCDDGLSPSCMSMEWHFRLAASQYVHDGVGVIEFAAITIVLLLAWRRTLGRQHGDRQDLIARGYRGLVVAGAVGYPLLGFAYLTNILGGVVEAAFFVGFTMIVVMQLLERASASPRDHEGSPGKLGAGVS